MTKGRYGRYGGQYIPETLMNAVLELERAYDYYKNEPQFMEELQTYIVNMQTGLHYYILLRK